MMQQPNPFDQFDTMAGPMGLPAGAVQIAPADPADAYDAPRAAAGLEGERLRNDASRRAAERAPFEARQAAAQARAAELAVARAERELAQAPQGGRADAQQRARMSSLDALVDQINRVEELYQANRGSWRGIPALGIGFPTSDNRQFNAAGAGLAEQGLAAFRVPGIGAQSDTELRQFVQANRPEAGDYNSEIEEKLRQLRSRVDATREGLGLPAAQWAGDRRDRRGVPGMEFRFNDEARAPEPQGWTDQQKAAYDGFIAANPRPTGDQLRSFASSIGLNLANADEIAAAAAGGGGIVGSEQAIVRQEDDQQRLERSRDTGLGAVDAAVRGAADVFAIGLSDELAAGADTLFRGGSYGENLYRQRAIDEADSNVNGVARFMGQAAAGLPLGYGAAIGGARLLAARPLLGAATAEAGLGAAYGAGSDNENRGRGAAIGGAAGLLGNQIGQRVLGPLAGAVSRSRPVQGARNAIADFRNLPRPSQPARVSPAEQMILSAGQEYGIDNIRSTLTEAQGLGLPMALADTDTRLRTLAGSAVRRSPVARDFAENTIELRAAGQAERAIRGIERDFGPTVNMGEAGDALTQQARAAASPIYEQAYAAPVVSTPELDAILATPAGRQALGRARTIAANERRDPSAMGFSLDRNGDVILNPVRVDLFGEEAQSRAAFQSAQEAYKAARRTPGADVDAARNAMTTANQRWQAATRSLRSVPSSGTAASQRGYTTQTLDYVKRGLDDVLEGYRDPITRRLNLDEAGRAMEGVRKSLIREVDRLNPNYGAARAAYEAPAKQRTALEAGYGAATARTNADQLGRMTTGLDDAQLGQFRTGYRTNLAEQVEKQRLTANPYNAIYGSPDQRAKIGGMFAGNASRFARQVELERQMGKTAYETLGGSPTAARLAADEAFAPGLGAQLVGESAIGAMTGTPPVGAMTGALRRMASDRLALGFGSQAKAEQLAPMLLTADPQFGLNLIEDAARRQAAQAADRRRWQRAGGMFGGSLGLSILAAPK